MSAVQTRRQHSRFRYSWDMFFAGEDTHTCGQGRMYDLSCGGASFTTSREVCPPLGSHLMITSSYPYAGQHDFDIRSVDNRAKVVRINPHNNHTNRVAVEFIDHLTVCPCEGNHAPG